jgi:uncharacterized lipoprotein YbaY
MEAIMRRTLAVLTLLAVLLAGCGSSQPGTPAPVNGTQAPAATDAMPHY